ncbi:MULTISPECIES: DUF4248 domain-containing protein [Marinilabiliaceae]|uniref:DUF4248 domain-containing protein n=1 Tax=Plebeiibacterium marinum TaxID=2992111 RepID=A0AAE3MF58_9BACT|nr:DUF4248 domain-containing protein [Plebeiobacterium marinum]MCU4174394.1 DUF4248 domain-containing protein [Marinilabiliaceae bacterium N1Y90]MCW3806719.1 DUF4248 domain-containing protein [Plebeiobacterium marinum]
MINRRTILKQELVTKLYPNSVSIKSAMQHLRREIDTCPDLKRQIAKAGHTKRHYYNKQQLLLILEHFCVEPEEFEEL